jgi:hypothetical protein
MSRIIQSRLVFTPEDTFCPADGGLAPELIDKICDKFPEGKLRNGWQGHGSTCNDAYLMSVLEYARSIGIVIPPDCSAVKSGVDYRIFPDSEKANRATSKFVEVSLGGAILAQIGFLSDGNPFAVNDSRLKKGDKFEIGSAFAYPAVLVRSEAKRKILDAGLKGLSFVKLRIGENRQIKNPELVGDVWPAGVGPLYLLTSDVELPVCKNWMYDKDGRVFHPNEIDAELEICYPLNGRENMGALHYSKEEIAPYLDYDVVRTSERFYLNNSKVLVSKRLREVFHEIGFKGMNYDLGYFTVIDETPWPLGTDGPLHPRYSGPPPNPPVD